MWGEICAVLVWPMDFIPSLLRRVVLGSSAGCLQNEMEIDTVE